MMVDPLHFTISDDDGSLLGFIDTTKVKSEFTFSIRHPDKGDLTGPILFNPKTPRGRTLIEKNLKEELGLNSDAPKVVNRYCVWIKEKFNNKQKKKVEKEPKYNKNIALEVANNSNILELIGKAASKWSAKKSIIGEDNTKILTTLLCSGALYNKHQIILIGGESSGGKSLEANFATSFFKTKKVMRFSDAALDYTDLSEFNIIYLQEAGEDEYSQRRYRLLSGDDDGYSVEITTKDPETGRMKTEPYKIPPMTLISTTTALDIHPEFITRAWMLGVDESNEQTKKIVEWKFNESERLIKQAQGQEKFGVEYDRLKEFFGAEILKDYEVLIPYEKILAKEFEGTYLRERRDVDKIKDLIKLIALLHQHQRVIFERNGTEFLLSNIDDFYNTLDIGGAAIEQTMTGLDKRLNDALPKIKNLFENLEEEKEGRITKHDFAEELERTAEYSRKILEAFFNRGFLGKEEGKGPKPNKYYSTANLEKTSTLLVNFSKNNYNRAELEKKAIEFLKLCVFTNLGDTVNKFIGSTTTRNTLEDNGNMGLTLEEIEELIGKTEITNKPTIKKEKGGK